MTKILTYRGRKYVRDYGELLSWRPERHRWEPVRIPPAAVMAAFERRVRA